MTQQNESARDAAAQVRETGFVFLEAAPMRVLLAQFGGRDDWAAFVASWNTLASDEYMADHGRYRRRAHATYLFDATTIRRAAHQAHYQSRDYNSLNGGVERWFEPIAASIGDGPSMRTILSACRRFFSTLAPNVRAWHVEAHQFRIEASRDIAGSPTPEGVHRDGVDYVLVLLIARKNIASGTTSIHALDGKTLGSFTLIQPLDAALLDDGRVYHGVTAVQALDPGEKAYRDVLVVTLRCA